MVVRVAKKLGATLVLLIFLLVILVRGLFFSGVPWRSSLYLFARSRRVGAHRDAARKEMIDRLTRTAETIPFPWLSTYVQDHCFSGNRFEFDSGCTRADEAMYCLGSVTAYFGADCPPREAAQRMAADVPHFRKMLSAQLREPDGGPVAAAHDAQPVRRSDDRQIVFQMSLGEAGAIDWDVPGVHLVTEPRDRRWSTIRLKTRTTPEGMTAARIRETHQTVIAVRVGTTYFVLKRRTWGRRR